MFLSKILLSHVTTSDLYKKSNFYILVDLAESGLYILADLTGSSLYIWLVMKLNYS